MKYFASFFAIALLLIVVTVNAADTASKPDFSKVPGSVIAHLPAASKTFIGSPSIVILPDGIYLASHDTFGKALKEKPGTTYIYRSTDRGQTWQPLTEIKNAAWSKLFYQGALYLIGTTAHHSHGYCVIRKSTDGGRTWTEPKDENSGLLFPDLSYHAAPTPICYHDGRIWRAMEDEKAGEEWGHRFRAFMMSAPVDADLLKASSWTSSNALARNPGYFDGQFKGWLEGNAVCDPSGQMVNVLRVNHEKGSGLYGKAAVIRISEDGKTATFDPKTGFIDLPGGAKKFEIRYDEKSKAYWALSNPVLGPLAPEKNPERTRNTLALLRSKDLVHWEIRCVLLYDPDVEKAGFQYPEWAFDGDDIVAAVRTAYDDGLGGAENAHNANFLTFHRFKNFRDLTEENSVVPSLK